jgi:ABC-2 type transport system permease protein
MLRAFRSELIKLRRWPIILGGVLMIAIAVLNAYAATNQVINGIPAGSFLQSLAQSFHSTRGLVTLVDSSGTIVVAIAMIIVAANVTTEWSQGTLRNLLAREPRRLHLLAGKMLALLLCVIIFTIVALLAATGVTFALAGYHGISTAFWTGTDGIHTYLSFFANRLLSMVGYCLLAMTIAILTRSVAAAIGISLAYVLLGETLLGLVWQDGTNWLPVHLFDDLTAASSPMGYGSALCVALLWMIGFAVISCALFRYRDVSA